MRDRTTLTIAAIALILAAGSWWLWASGPAALPVDGDTPAVIPLVPPPAQDTLDSELAPLPVERTEPVRRVAPRAESESPSESSAAPSPFFVVGRVVDLAGRGWAGVTVGWTSQRLTPEIAHDIHDPGSPYAKTFVNTAGDGSFEFAIPSSQDEIKVSVFLPRTPVWVAKRERISGPSGCSAQSFAHDVLSNGNAPVLAPHVTVSHDHPLAEIVLVAPEGIHVRGRVMTPRQSPAWSPTVYLQHSEYPFVWHRIDANARGEFELPAVQPGEWILRTYSGWSCTPAREISLVPGPDIDLGDLVVGPGAGSVRGRLVAQHPRKPEDRFGLAFQSITVQSTYPDDRRPRWLGTGRTDGNGEFLIVSLPIGPVRVTANLSSDFAKPRPQALTKAVKKPPEDQVLLEAVRNLPADILLQLGESVAQATIRWAPASSRHSADEGSTNGSSGEESLGQGRARSRFQVLSPWPTLRLTVTTPDGRQWTQTANPEPEQHTVVVIEDPERKKKR